jgi:Tfp pilus assembly protein PilO
LPNSALKFSSSAQRDGFDLPDTLAYQNDRGWRSLWRQGLALNWRDAGRWTRFQRLLAYLGLALLTAALCQWLWLSQGQEELLVLKDQEPLLRSQLKAKLNADVQRTLQHQTNRLAELDLFATESRLPLKSGMDQLLDSISHAATAQGLQIEAFKPQPVQVQAPYVEQSIQLRIDGGFAPMGAFAAELAQLPSVFALTNMRLQINKTGQLTLEGNIKVLRLPDTAESAQINAKAAKPGEKAALNAKPGEDGK